MSLQAEESSAEGPLLWAVQELAAPLEARLRHHFASGLPTDRPDRPEWLFATALRVAREAGPQLAPLQPALAVTAPGLIYDVQAIDALALLWPVKFAESSSEPCSQDTCTTGLWS